MLIFKKDENFVYIARGRGAGLSSLWSAKLEAAAVVHP